MINNTLNVFDIDDTLFRTTARAHIFRDGVLVNILSNQELTYYKPHPDDEVDWCEFESAELFANTAAPIGRMVGKLKTILRHMPDDSKTILMTARQDFDDPETFLETFRTHGIDIDRIHVERTGNLKLGSSAKNKRFYFHKYLRSNRFAKVRFFDDSKPNLNSFKALKKYYPDVEFEAWLVKGDGTTERF